MAPQGHARLRLRVDRLRFVAGALHRRQQLGAQVGRGVRCVQHLRARRRQVDAGLQHTRHGRQCTLDAADAGRTGHAADGQRQARMRHRVAGVLDGGEQGLDIDAGPVARFDRHGRALGGQVDAGRSHARHGRQRALDAPDARGAAHALDR